MRKNILNIYLDKRQTFDPNFTYFLFSKSLCGFKKVEINVANIVSPSHIGNVSVTTRFCVFGVHGTVRIYYSPACT